MKKFVAAMIFVATGFVAGWQARNFSVDRQFHSAGVSSIPSATAGRNLQFDDLSRRYNDEQNSNQQNTRNNGQQGVISLTDKPIADPNPSAEFKEQSSRSSISLTNTVELFIFYLNERQHSEALNLFRELEFRNSNAAAELKVILVNRLKEYLANKQQEYFTDLVNTYLASYYNDVEVLLLVADFNARSDYFSESLATHQLIRTYAHGKADRQRATDELNKLISSVDKQHSDSGMWYELQIFYELLEQYGLANPQHRFRLAEIYASNGYEELSKNIFQDLLSHPQWGKQAGLRLSAMAEDQVPQVSAASYAEEIPLQAIGEHYLVTVGVGEGIGESDRVNLVIDTGASTTLVSSQGFSRLSGYNNFVRLPSRMFNTVNGITRGTVYIVPEFHLGSYKLHDVEIAVVDFEPGANVDGLLGMNVLRNFRFEIDQDAVALLLKERERN